MSARETSPLLLSAVLRAHTADVRAVAYVSETTLVSSSRDKSVILWDVPSAAPDASLTEHSAFVNAVVSLESNDVVFVASSGASKLIIVSVAPSLDVTYTLSGHSANVCALASVPGMTLGLISGSWDKTAMVWEGEKCVFTLKGHAQAVWAVDAIDSNSFITGSADNTMRLWEGEKCVREFTGHEGPVRAIKILPPLPTPTYGESRRRVASAGNDCSVRIWCVDTGAQLAVLAGHTSFVYSLDYARDSLLTCGEDRTLRRWSEDGVLLQTIYVPATSAWAVAVSPNSRATSGNNCDVALAASDGNVYVYTTDPARVARDDIQSEYEAGLASFQISTETTADIQPSQIKGPEALEEHGNADGQVILVRRDGAAGAAGAADAHQWNATSSRWVRIGQVVDSVASTRKKVLHNGAEYDYVFEIDVGTGANLKLPYNCNQNPYSVALAFLEEHSLDATFLEQVAQFIIKNTKTATISQAGAGDPYTGQTSNQHQLESAPAESRDTDSALLVPIYEYVVFRQPVNFSGVARKVMELAAAAASAAAAAGGGAESAYNNVVMTDLKSSMIVARQLISDPNWPKAAFYPAFDVLRAHVANGDQSVDNEEARMYMRAFLSSLESKSEPNAMTGFWLATNLLARKATQSAVISENAVLLTHINDYRETKNAKLRISLATYLLNIAIYMIRERDLLPELLDVMALLTAMAEVEVDQEGLYRLTVALGTLCAQTTGVKSYIVQLQVAGILSKIQSNSQNEERVRHAARDSLVLARDQMKKT